jgi:hypothetical protein
VFAQQRGGAEAESCISCGELNAPPARMISPGAPAVRWHRPAVYLDADCALSLEQHARRERLETLSGFARLRAWLEISGCRRAAPPVARGELVIAKAFLDSAVEIRIAFVAALLGRFDESNRRSAIAPDSETASRAPSPCHGTVRDLVLALRKYGSTSA